MGTRLCLPRRLKAVLSPCVDKLEYEDLKKRAPVSKKFRYLGCAGDLFSSTWWDYPQNVQRCTPGPDGFCDDGVASCGDDSACPLVPVKQTGIHYVVNPDAFAFWPFGGGCQSDPAGAPPPAPPRGPRHAPMRASHAKFQRQRCLGRAATVGGSIRRSTPRGPLSFII